MNLVLILLLIIAIMIFYIIYMWTSEGKVRELKYKNRDLERKIDFLVEEFGEEGKDASERWDMMNR